MSDIQSDGFGTVFAIGATPTSPNGGAYGGGGSNTLVFRAQEPNPSGNVYATFAAVYAARQLISGPVVIEIDDSIDACYIEDSGGDPYDLNDVVLRGYRTLGFCDRSSVYLNEGAKLINFREVRDLNCYSYSSQPIVTLEDNQDSIRLTNAMLEDDQGGGWFTLIDSLLAISMFQGSSLSNDDGYVVNVDNNSAVFATLDDTNTNLQGNTISGDGILLVICGADAQFDVQPIANFNASLAADATRIGFNPSDPGNWPDYPTTTADALNKLAARVYALEHP